MTTSIQKHSCGACARRKVKCDKLSPCSSCSKSQSECVYQAPTLSQRHRKRPADEDLLSKISEYEELLRKNNIQFEPLDNPWIPSPLEEKLVSRPQPPRPVSYASLPALGEIQQCLTLDPQSQSGLPGAKSKATCPLAGLPKELRNPSIQQLKKTGKELEDEVTGTTSSSGIVTSLLIPVRLNGAPQPLELHPGPKHIFKLWQAFTENVNPLIKVIHTPSLQQRILETSWNLETITRPLEAVMFSVYALATASMKPSDCVHAFGETRSILLNRYRSGAAQALAAAELHSTRDLEVLQAFVLFLLVDPRSELSVTVVAIATRMGHKMGLHRTGADSHMPFFEQEMRLRVWWQIMGLESRARRKVLGLTSPTADYGDVRMPLNVDDADLHPHMAHRPVVEHPGATEMLYCLMKYEVAHYARSPLAAATTQNAYEVVDATSPSLEGLARKRKILGDLERIYESKYLRHCDPRIPLHHLSATVAGLTTHRLRFWSYHPRHQPSSDSQPMSQADQDVVFESSVRLLQLDAELRASPFSAHLLQHQRLARTEVEALVYMVAALRRRVRGDLVRPAWAQVARMYDEYPPLLRGEEGFYKALADLTLEAWRARWLEVGKDGGAVPGFIEALQGTRGVVTGSEDHASMAVNGGDMVLDGGFQFGLMFDDPLDWVYWDELPQL